MGAGRRPVFMEGPLDACHGVHKIVINRPGRRCQRQENITKFAGLRIDGYLIVRPLHGGESNLALQYLREIIAGNSDERFQSGPPINRQVWRKSIRAHTRSNVFSVRGDVQHHQTLLPDPGSPGSPNSPVAPTEVPLNDRLVPAKGRAFAKSSLAGRPGEKSRRRSNASPSSLSTAI